jgi:hypothetical protein
MGKLNRGAVAQGIGAGTSTYDARRSVKNEKRKGGWEAPVDIENK